MKDTTIAILETRVGAQMADLVRKYGGIPFSAPALSEIPDIDPTHIVELIGDASGVSRGPGIDRGQGNRAR